MKTSDPWELVGLSMLSGNSSRLRVIENQLLWSYFQICLVQFLSLPFFYYSWIPATQNGQIGVTLFPGQGFHRRIRKLYYHSVIRLNTLWKGLFLASLHRHLLRIYQSIRRLFYVAHLVRVFFGAGH